jgi:hypothetical protein
MFFLFVKYYDLEITISAISPAVPAVIVTPSIGFERADEDRVTP